MRKLVYIKGGLFLKIAIVTTFTLPVHSSRLFQINNPKDAFIGIVGVLYAKLYTVFPIRFSFSTQLSGGRC